MKAVIGFQDLTISCIIGDLPYEREVEQELRIDLSFEANIKTTDRLEDTIDYVKASEVCARIAQEGKFRLIETCASAILDELLQIFPLNWVKIKVKKREAIAKADFVYVELLRYKEEGTWDGLSSQEPQTVSVPH